MSYGAEPILIENYENLNLTEFMHYQYLPVIMENGGPRLPDNIKNLRDMIVRAFCSCKPRKYAYVTCKKGFATPDNPLNRPGWHCDGFETDDLNFIWWKGSGTRFAIQYFNDISTDHIKSMQQFEEQVRESSIVTYDEGNLYMLTPEVVHATPIIKPPGEIRQFVKISLSDKKYNLENNSHNYLFDYKWEMHSRNQMRNDPHCAQKDFI